MFTHISAEGRMQEQIGDYVIEERLGQGGMGVVFRARHITSGARVALKLAWEKACRNLRREVKMLKALNHPNVVKVLDHGEEEDGRAWVAMELIEGVPLNRHIADSLQTTDGFSLGAETLCTNTFSDSGLHDTVPDTSYTEPPAREDEPAAQHKACTGLTDAVKRMMGWMTQLCDALDYVHGQGIAHLDIKPSNILIDTRSQRAILIDFGIARRVAPGVVTTSGTTAFASPERLQGKEITTRADLYALGCILYKITTGRMPFTGKERVRLIQQHITTPPTPPSALGLTLPELLEEKLLALLAKRPEERPERAGCLVEALEMAAEG